MSGPVKCKNVYGPSAVLVNDGATVHVSPYHNAVHMVTKEFPRDIKGRLMVR